MGEERFEVYFNSDRDMCYVELDSKRNLVHIIQRLPSTEEEIDVVLLPHEAGKLAEILSRLKKR